MHHLRVSIYSKRYTILSINQSKIEYKCHLSVYTYLKRYQMVPQAALEACNCSKYSQVSDEHFQNYNIGRIMMQLKCQITYKDVSTCFAFANWQLHK